MKIFITLFPNICILSGITNRLTNCNNGNESETSDNLKSDKEDFQNSINCRAVSSGRNDNNTLCVKSNGRSSSITSNSTSSSIIPVHNNKLADGHRYPQKFDDNEESIPLIQNSMKSDKILLKNDIHSNHQCKNSKTMPELYIDNEGIAISQNDLTKVTINVQLEEIKYKNNKNLSNTYSVKKVQKPPSTSNNINQINVYQNQASQIEGRSKHHVNFERLDIDQNSSPKFSLRSPIKDLTHVVAKRRQERYQSETDQTASKNKSIGEGNGRIHGNRKCYSSTERKKKKHVSLEAKRERKAAKTLAIVTGAFIACWLPFFVVAVLIPIFGPDKFNPRLFAFSILHSIALWLGYFNSILNPIIYTVFSPEFRQAFQKILCGKSAAQNHWPRHLQ